MKESKPALAADLLQVGRGFLMGGADIIPGVSGGTVALILGIYQRLVTAISRVDVQFVRLIARGQLSRAAAYIDLRFLVTLGAGIGCGILGLARLMNYLLENHAVATWSVFFGLIVASSLLVAKMVERWSVGTTACGLAGAAFAYWLVGVLPAVPPAGHLYVFLCGVIGICAMILPGISGSFILLIMGKYSDITGAIRSLTDGTADSETFVTLAVFAAGCLLGLLGFSKVLRQLLTRWESPTMAVLCGFLFGSLRKIWPFKNDLTHKYLDMYGMSTSQLTALKTEPAKYAHFLKKHDVTDAQFDALLTDPHQVVELVSVSKRLYENTLPPFDGTTLKYVALALAAVVFVFVLDRIARGSEHVPPLEAEA